MSEPHPNGKTIKPGSTIGILGGGQLGRMLAQSAARMGYHCVVYDQDQYAPAAQVAGEHIKASYEDKKSLQKFASMVDVVTTEFESVPDIALANLKAQGVLLRPDQNVFEIASNRYKEKQFVKTCGLSSPLWRVIASKEELEAALSALGEGGVLKVAKGGYDGKGQIRVNRFQDAEAAWQELATDLAIYEEWLEDVDEISVIVGRNGRGEKVHFEPSYNRHNGGILEMSVVPSDMEAGILEKATDIAFTLAERFAIHGLLAVELFVTSKGDVLVNEMAPRPHNSGHWTIEGAENSQFDVLIHMICNLPLPSTARLFDAEMINLIGSEIENWQELLKSYPSGKLHIYGKKEVREGRKMGHFTRLLPFS